jgi:membrane-associated protease RseP (regulator of RpoE activity)
MEFGNVQRGILGIEGGELNNALSKELGIKEVSGVYVSKVNKKSGAEKAGLQKGDVITKLDERTIFSYADLAGFINTKRPNDKVEVTFIRNQVTKTALVTLTKYDVISTDYKGIELENIDANDKKKFRIDYGVKIKELNNEQLNEFADDLKNGIILSIGNVNATDVETVSKLLSKVGENQNVQIEMITQNGQRLRIIL